MEVVSAAIPTAVAETVAEVSKVSVESAAIAAVSRNTAARAARVIV